MDYRIRWFWSDGFLGPCRRLGVAFSVTVGEIPQVKDVVAAIPEAEWIPIDNDDDVLKRERTDPWKGYFEVDQVLPRESCGAGKGGRRENPSRHPRDHLPPGVALFQVGDRCRYFGERIAPVDLRAHLAGLNQIRKELQILWWLRAPKPWRYPCL